MTETIEDVLTNHVDEQGFCTLTITRPKRMNTLNGPLVDGLWHTFYEIAYEPEVRVVVLTGQGDRAFCAGADLKERVGMSEAQVKKRIDDYGKCFATIEQ